MIDPKLEVIAKKYVLNGLSIIPVKGKKPLVKWEKYQSDIPTQVDLDNWFKNPDLTGIALVCNQGITVIDFDHADFYTKWLDRVGDKADGLPIQKSKKGFHVAFRCAEYNNSSKKLAWIPHVLQEDDDIDTKNIPDYDCAIETRGQNSYILLAPSAHPYGGNYEALHGNFYDIPEIDLELAETLIKAAKDLNEKLEFASLPVKRKSGNSESNVIDAFNDQNSIESMLASQGYIQKTRSRWMSPTSKSNNAGVFVFPNGLCYSHHSDELADELAHDAFDVYRIFEHHGDFTSAVRQAAIDLGLDYKVNKEQSIVEVAVKDKPLLTEVGNANLFLELHGDKLRFAPTLGWLLWDGKRWNRDQNNYHLFLARDVGKYLFDQAKDELDLEQQKKLLSWANRSLALRAMKSFVELASTDTKVVIDASKLDSHKYLLNLNNGTYNLQDNKLELHDRNDLLSKLANADYKQTSTCPKWLAFQHEITNGDEELVRFKQRAFGYALSGDIEAQAFFVLWGNGANGKSTELSVIASLLGEYATTTSIDTFLDNSYGNATLSAVAQLKGSRFVSASESEQSRKLNEAIIKSVTGGESITAKYYYRDSFEYFPEFKLFMSTNHKPEIHGTDEGIWRRLKLIPYTVTIPPEKRNPRLKEELLAEASGILNWLIEGYQMYLAKGLGSSKAVDDAIKSYRTEQDVVQLFIDEICFVDMNAQAGATELYDAYKKWSDYTGQRTMTQHAFGKRLTELGYAKKKSNKGVLRIGLELLGANPNEYTQSSEDIAGMFN